MNKNSNKLKKIKTKKNNNQSITAKKLKEVKNIYQRAIRDNTPKECSKDTLKDYIHQVIHQNVDSDKLHRMPLLATAATHVVRKRFEVNAVANANGDFFYYLVPSRLPASGTGANSVSAVYVNHTSYSSDSTIPNILPAGIYGDGRIIDGMNLTSGHFDTAVTIGFHVTGKLSGVSPLNKQGLIYVAEDSDLSYAIANKVSSPALTLDNLLNLYSITNITKLNNYMIVDIVNSRSSLFKYHYIPTDGYSNTKLLVPGALNISNTYLANDGAFNQKQLIIIGKGLAPNTSVTMIIEMYIQVEPDVTQLGTYPTSYSSCYVNPDPELKYLASQKDLILSEGDDHDKFNQNTYMMTNSQSNRRPNTYGNSYGNARVIYQ
jgi:hypothetical protein